MPGTSGLDVVKLYRFSHSDGPDMPFIALTADATPETRKLCEEAGMKGYITKPVDSARLLESIYACVAKQLDAKETPGPAADDDRVTDITSHPRFIAEKEPVLDLQAMKNIESLEPGTEFLTHVLEHYITDTEQVLREMAAALYARNLRDIRDSAHALRSSSANIGALRVHRLCSDLCGITTQEMERMAEGKLKALNEEFRRFRTTVTEYLNRRRRSGQPS
jgi:two-component system sensor histidine kinase RpfC